MRDPTFTNKIPIKSQTNRKVSSWQQQTNKKQQKELTQLINSIIQTKTSLTN